MNLRGIIKRITPPILFDVYHNYQQEYIWEGVYKDFNEVPAAGDGFESETWINLTQQYTDEVITTAQNYSPIPGKVEGEHALLPLVAALVCHSSGAVRVLDFGGGLGVAYVHLNQSLAACHSIDYHVIETQKICEMGAKLFEKDQQIHFYSALPTHLRDVDIVYISSALQYVSDYKSLLERLCAYQPKYFLMVKLSAGNIPTYATAQKNVKGSVIPYWFINVQELVQIMAKAGYALSFKGALARGYNQNNFPEQYQLKYACNLLFARTL